MSIAKLNGIVEVVGMGGLTTHVLDLVSGKPAAGVRITVVRCGQEQARLLADAVTNPDGRVDRPLISEAELTSGYYEISFYVGDYFARATAHREGVRFLDVVPLRFGVDEPAVHYHVPLLVTPWSFSTYRGS